MQLHFEIIIADSSTIIVLYETDLLYLLHEIYTEVTITPQVAQEIKITLPGWMKINAPSDEQMVSTLLKDLDEGEASSIALALEHKNSLLIIDEKDGRKVPISLNIPIIGTLAILFEAKQKKLVSSFKECLNKLLNKGFRVSPQLIEKFLTESGEE
jgi:predicted nucleic acid-binding protein